MHHRFGPEKGIIKHTATTRSQVHISYACICKKSVFSESASPLCARIPPNWNADGASLRKANGRGDWRAGDVGRGSASVSGTVSSLVGCGSELFVTAVPLDAIDVNVKLRLTFAATAAGLRGEAGRGRSEGWRGGCARLPVMPDASVVVRLALNDAELRFALGLSRGFCELIEPGEM